MLVSCLTCVRLILGAFKTEINYELLVVDLNYANHAERHSTCEAKCYKHKGIMMYRVLGYHSICRLEKRWTMNQKDMWMYRKSSWKSS